MKGGEGKSEHLKEINDRKEEKVDHIDIVLRMKRKLW